RRLVRHARSIMASLPRLVTAVAIASLLAAHAAGQSTSNDAPDLAMYGRIRDEGIARSRVMDYATELMDGIGPRLTGSPNLDKAISWAMEKLAGAGSTN